MAFPAVAANASTASAASASPFPVTLPASIAAGDILIIQFNRLGGAQTFSASGWNAPVAGHAINASTFINGLLWKVADGSEGSSVNVTSTVATSQNAIAIAYRISGGQSVEVSTIFDGSTANPDPPSLTPSWGSADTLWIAAACVAGSRTVSAYPTNYASNQLSNNNFSPGTVSMATRQNTASSEDPGTYTYSGSTSVAAYTLGVQPATVATDTLFAQACL